MCGFRRNAWRKWCGGALLVTLSMIYLEIKAHNQHGYHSILQRYVIPSGLRLVGQFVFQQNNDPTHLQAVYGLFYQEGEWWSAASDDLASTITRPQPN